MLVPFSVSVLHCTRHTTLLFPSARSQTRHSLVGRPDCIGRRKDSRLEQGQLRHENSGLGLPQPAIWVRQSGDCSVGRKITHWLERPVDKIVSFRLR